MISRRNLFLGSAAIILTPGVLMPVRKVWVPRSMDYWRQFIWDATSWEVTASLNECIKAVAEEIVAAQYDRHGQRGFIPGDFRPTRVIRNDHWMRNIA